jgi:hypothetical protein
MIYFNSDEIQIYRQRRIGSTNRYSVSATFTAYNMDIQPESRPDRLQMSGNRYGTQWVGFIDANVDIKEGDEIRVTDTGKKYGVKGVQKWAGAGLLDHIELTLISQDGV